jgi:alkylated DNA repair dioxygenase AlkB
MSQVEAKLSAIPADIASAGVSSLQSNTKPHTQNQDLHDHAVKLLVDIDASEKRSSDYNKRRREATEKLRPVLKKIWEAFDNGETVGGCTGKKEWCKQVRSITYRRCLQIINGESQTKQVKSLHLVVGKLVTIDGDDTVYEIRGIATRSSKMVGDCYTITFIAKPLETNHPPQPSDLVAHVKEERHDVYIGRKNVRGKRKFAASIWGNTTGSLEKYEAYVRSSPELLHQLASLKSKVLGCWHTVADRRKKLCCHGDVLLKLIDEFDGKPLPPIPAVKSYADGAVTVRTTFYNEEEVKALFDDCTKLNFVRGTVRGKERRHAVRIFCDVETAVRRKEARSPLSEAPDAVKKLLAELSKHSGKNVNYAAVVEYRDGDDYIAPHQHNEDRGNDATVWIVSTGAERPFVVKPVNGGAPTKLLATQGSLITLSSEANEMHLHSVPKRRECTGVRYSVNCKAIPSSISNPEVQETIPSVAGQSGASSTSVASPATIKPQKDAKTVKTNYEHKPSFLTKQEADELYDLLLPLPWNRAEDGSGQIAYGVSYDRGGPAPNEFAEIPEFIGRLGDGVSTATRHPWNFAQLHKYVSARAVFPHVDPPMVVPMLTLGQERVFRYGGTMYCEKCEQSRMPICPHYFSVRQKNRPMEAHQPEQTTLMRHGDLLVFYGSAIIHSMFPASQDSQFNPNGREFRFSLLFRYTTEAMREFGVGKCNRHGHEKQYRDAVKKFQDHQAKNRNDEAA